MDVIDVQDLNVADLAKLYEDLDIKSLSFEQAMELLEVVVNRMEGGALTMVQSITLQEFGKRLGEHCNSLLDSKETQLQTIKAEAESVLDSEA